MSLCVKLYQNSDELFQSDWWSVLEQKTIVVCPSPSDADRLRAKLSSHTNIDVLTISKFVSNQLSLIADAPEVSRKADLMLKLSVFWKRIFPEFSFERFLQCFTLLTELRGTSLEVETMQEVLAEYHEDVANGVTMLWRAMQASNLHDEHSSYWTLAQAYRSTPSPFDDEQSARVIIYGFAHLSGMQIDLLKAMAIRHEVLVPYQHDLYLKRFQSDWISWLDTVAPESEASASERQLGPFKVHSFAKNRLAEVLKDQLKSSHDVVLGTSNALWRDYLEIPLAGMFYKNSVDLLDESFGQLEQHIRDLLLKNDQSLVASKDLCTALQVKMNECIANQNFRLLKACQLLLEVIGSWQDLSADNTEIGIFDWEVLRQSSRLKSPRIYQAPNLSTIALQGRVRAFNDIIDLESNQKVIVCLTSSHNSPKMAESDYSVKVTNLLTVLGPRRRKELDFQLLKVQFYEMLERCDVTFFIEDGLLEHDLGWAEMFKSIQLERQADALTVKRVRRDLLNQRSLKVAPPLKMISPSRLQTYLDCPRQFYYQYIEKLSDQPELHKDLEPRVLGEIEHKVVEEFFKISKVWDEALHRKLTRSVFDQWLKNHKITLSDNTYVAHFVEVQNFSRQGIMFVVTLLAQLPQPELLFEAEYQDGIFKGRVDLLIKTSMGTGIIDFKRSSASVPSKSSHENHDKIQLWTYLAHAQQNKDYLFWGYICLKDPSESLFYSTWNELQNIFTDVFDDGVKVLGIDTEQVNQQLTAFDQLESSLVEKLKVEDKWEAKPNSGDVCTFCSVQTLCSRGVVHD